MSVIKRVSIIISILWGLAFIIGANSKYRFDWNLVLFGIIALVIAWGIYWVVLGFKSKPVNKEPNLVLIPDESNECIDASYEAKLKQFGIKQNTNISLRSIIFLIFISLALGFGQAFTGVSGKHFYMATAIGFNLPMAGLVSGLYC